MLEKDLIVNETVNIKSNKGTSIVNYLKKTFSFKTLSYMLVLILVSQVTYIGVKPFAIAMLAVASIFEIPLLIPLITTLLSYIIFKVDVGTVVNYGIIYVIYTTLVYIIDIKGFSKKYTIYIKLGIAVLFSNIISLLILRNPDTITNRIIECLLIMVSYPVFTYGMSMLTNITKKIVFSKEEIISLTVLLVVALVPFAKYEIMGFSIVNVLLTIIVIIIGWKNDWMTGTAAGVIAGLVYSIALKQNSLLIMSFTFSGLIAGVLSRYNKWIVILGYILGNFLLAYLYTKDIIMFGRLAEILVAAAVIIALPRKVIFRLEDIFGTNHGLRKGYEYLLGAARDSKDRLNAMSEVFDNLSHITTEVTEETVDETKNVIKKYLEDYKANECIGCKNKTYCLSQDLDMVAEHIASRLENNLSLSKEMLPLDCDLSQELLANIQDIYSNIKLMRIVKEKEKESNTKLAEEYKAITGLINHIAKDENVTVKDTPEQKRIREELKYMGYVVYEDMFKKKDNDITYEFITDILIDIDKAKKEIQKIVSDVVGTKMNIKLVLNSSKTERSRIRLVPSSKYIVKATVKQIRKADSTVSGDSYIVTEFKDNDKVIAISDGMGSGPVSKEVSTSVISMIEKMGNSGFNKNEIINIVNKLIKLKEMGEVSSTLDMCVVNEKKDILEFVKLGAACSYVIENNIVEEIKQDNMPIGIVTNVQYTTVERSISKGMYVVLMSDGAASDVNKNMLQDIVDKLSVLDFSEKDLMNKIMSSVVGDQNKITLDDVTIVVCKIV